MPTELDKITSSMATDSTGMSKAWLYWFQRVIKLMGQKIDALLNATGKIPTLNASGELVDSGLTAASVVSTSDTATSDNAVVRMDGVSGVTIHGSLATVDDDGTVNIPSGQTYNINGSEHTHTSSTVSLALDDLTDVATNSEERGDILFRDATGWVNLHHGTSGQMLTSGGHGADPSWATPLAPGGNDNNIQYKSGNGLAGEDQFSYNPSTNEFYVAGEIGVGIVTPADKVHLYSAYEPGITFTDTSGAAGHKSAKVLYDGGTEIGGIGGWVWQRLTDAYAYAASLFTFWNDGSVHFGGISRPTTAGNVKISSGALETDDILLKGTYQPQVVFQDTNAAGPAGHHAARIIYDSGVEISSIGGWIMQALTDALAFSANLITIWKDGSVHFGGITRPDAAGGVQISSGKLEVVGYNIETNKQVVSTLATGTSPLSVSSTTYVNNLNADMVDGYHYYDLVDSGGWSDYSGTWTYASSATFTVSGDQTAIFKTGTKIKIYQTTWKYFDVVSSTYSSPNTTVTVTGGNDYSIANATIVNPAYSYAANPKGHPIWYNYTIAWTGFSSNPTTNLAIFCIIGRVCHFIQWCNKGTSNSTSTTSDLPVTSKNGWFFINMAGRDNDVAVAPVTGTVNAGSKTVTWTKDITGAAWTASSYKNVHANGFYEI
jgi:hypothetical protein